MFNDFCDLKTYKIKHDVSYYLIHWASGLGVMTSRLQRGGHRFNSGLAHHK